MLIIREREETLMMAEGSEDASSLLLHTQCQMEEIQRDRAGSHASEAWTDVTMAAVVKAARQKT